MYPVSTFVFFFNDTATTEIYTLSLHDALPILGAICKEKNIFFIIDTAQTAGVLSLDFNKLNCNALAFTGHKSLLGPQDRKSTRLNSSHANISYAVFCLNKIIEASQVLLPIMIS